MEYTTEQLKFSDIGKNILLKYGIVYYAFEMRVGKTLTALRTAELIKAKNVLFVTKKSGIVGVNKMAVNFNYEYNLTVINYEMLHKYTKIKYDCIICDEIHTIGSFPKPSITAKILKNIVGSKNLILLSGTPTAESYSRIYHQLWISEKSPYNKYKNFYGFAREYITPHDIKVNGDMRTLYDRCSSRAIDDISHLMVTLSRAETGRFAYNNTIETVQTVACEPRLDRLINRLINRRVYQFRDGNLLTCDTMTKLKQCIHQICSGTIKVDNGSRKILDTSKLNYIVENYFGKYKIAIMYKYIAEGDLLRQTFKNNTKDSEEYNNSDDNTLVYITQVSSRSMGVDISAADMLIMYNIDYSATLYFQAISRIINMNSVKMPRVIWLFSDLQNGIENKIYSTVKKKKPFTNYYFLRDYNITEHEYKKAS